MEKHLKEEIIKASDSIRKKFRSLKKDESLELETNEKRLAPLVSPLKTLIDLTQQKDHEVKVEPKIKVEPRIVVSKTPRKRKPKEFEADSLEEDNETSGEEIYESLDEINDTSLQKWNDYTSTLGPQSKSYLNGKLFSAQPGRYDSKFGVRMDTKSNNWKIGTKPIEFDKSDTIHIGNYMVQGTPGLFELLFKSIPDMDKVRENDKEVYKQILELTNAHFQEYNPLKKIASSNSYKYKKIISPLFKEPKGSGLLPVNDNKIDYIRWNDPNELVSRLELLIASREAGNTAHLAEIASIEEELREENIIQ